MRIAVLASPVFLALTCWAQAGAQPSAESTISRVEVQGESSAERDRKTLGQLYEARALFEKYHQLAPQAELKFKVYARTDAERTQAISLGVMTPSGRLPVVLDEGQRFVIDPAWQELDKDTELRSRLPDGRVTWRPYVRTPGYTGRELRLGDLRLQCRASFDSGLGRRGTLAQRVLERVLFPFGRGSGCAAKSFGWSTFIDQPVFAVTLQYGERRMPLSNVWLHGLKDGSGEGYDWGFALREYMVRLPMGDESWPDDTRVVLEFMDDPATPPDEALLHSPSRLAALAPVLKPGETTLDEAHALLGASNDERRFESGRSIARYLQLLPATPLPQAASAQTVVVSEPAAIELVLLFKPDGRLQKYALHQLQPGQRWK